MLDCSFEKLFNMGEYDIVEQFSLYFFNMKYDEAMQIVGVMKCKGMDDARRLEAMLYFEQKKFLKVRGLLKEELELTTEEKEFYFASLIELNLYEEFVLKQEEIHNYEVEKHLENPITYDCYLYLDWLLSTKEKTQEMLKKVKYTTDKQSYFSRQYAWCIVTELVDIFCLNEERLQLQKAGISYDDIDDINKRLEKRFDVLKRIYYEADTFHSLVIEGKSIPIGAISFVAKSNCFAFTGPRGEGIYDVIHYMDLHRRMSVSTVETIVREYKENLKMAVEEGNEFVIDFLKNTYFAVSDGKHKDDSYIGIFTEILGEVPYVFEELDAHKDEGVIMSILSPKGKLAYKAALMQFAHSLEHEYGALDAGMLCLSYMRILELEINQRVIIPLAENIEEIEKSYTQGLNNYKDEKKKEVYRNNWSYIISYLKKVKSKESDGFMMGTICCLFERMKVKEYKKDINSEKLRACIDNYLSVLLSEVGNKNREKIERIFASKNREKYRNPPAHTRYVGIRTALECRSFVETNLIFINDCIL